MTTAPLPHYRGRYSRQGSLAVLCEGDVLAMRSTSWKNGPPPILTCLLRMCRPCGTKEAIFGVADAIGRSVPIGVIEDRDFRSAQDAARLRGKPKGPAGSRS